MLPATPCHSGATIFKSALKNTNKPQKRILFMFDRKMYCSTVYLEASSTVEKKYSDAIT